MAKSTNNIVTHGLRGKVGDILIFRYVNGDTIVSKVPEKRKTTSEAQIKHNRIRTYRILEFTESE
ncbi:MAG: hypothetical protein LBS43_07135 [Prevotellaceae bacterium]|jgi:hypothetical protein|nr:hypothetical protein [Prevotellaceae bacterium]